VKFDLTKNIQELTNEEFTKLVTKCSNLCGEGDHTLLIKMGFEYNNERKYRKVVDKCYITLEGDKDIDVDDMKWIKIETIGDYLKYFSIKYSFKINSKYFLQINK